MEAQPMQVLEIFYSYAREDEILCDQLQKQLKRNASIVNWHDRKIPPGKAWAGAIDEHLNTADIILLLISPDFMNSDYCYRIEMTRAMERHASGEARVIPVILRSVIWEDAPFSSLNVLPLDGRPVTSWHNQDDAFFHIASELNQVFHEELRTRNVARSGSTTIFLSAASPNKKIIAQLKTDLQVQGITIETDDEGLRTAIRNVSSLLLVASPDARNSRKVKDALCITEMYRRPICAIWIASKQWEESVPSGYEKIPYVDARGIRYEQGIRDIAMMLRGNSPTNSQTTERDFEPRNPYKGLRAFTSKDTEDFFGRDQLIDHLCDAFEKVLVPSNEHGRSNRLLAIIGPSGSGKSSLVQAGVLPGLQAGSVSGSDQWLYLAPLRLGIRPIESLALALEEYLPRRSLTSLREDLDDDSTRGLHRLGVAITKRRWKRMVLFIDQFEELFTRAIDEDERKRFLDILVSAVTEPHGPIIVILTLRADFYDRPMHYPEFGLLIEEHHEPVLPMEMKDLREVIEGPARLPDVQLLFERNLVGDILFDVQGQIGALPLLQFTLEELFQQRNGYIITLDAYGKIGGVKGALAQHAESIYQSLSSDEHRRLARALFLRLIDPGITERDTTRRRAVRSELSLPDREETAIIEEVATTFIKERLLTADQHTLEVSHEALIREWNRLKGWLHDARADIQLQKALSEDTAEWKRHGKSEERVYRGMQLFEVQQWAERNVPSQDEMDFLRASADALASQQSAEDAQHERELALQRRATRRLQYSIVLMAGICVVLVVALVANLILQGRLQQTVTALQKALPAKVTNNKDDGPGSLRQALATASPGETITFATTLTGTITLKSGALDITRDLIISGPGAPILAISGNHQGSILNIASGVNVIIFGLTLEDANTAEDIGGGIYNAGDLTLVNCIIAANSTHGNGGGIYNAGSLTLRYSTVSANTAQGDGGGIYSFGPLVLTDSTISSNQSINGGGLYVGSSAAITTSTISGNTATSGGGIAVGGGTMVNIVYSTIDGNRAVVGGGLVIARQNTASVQMTACIVAGNQAMTAPDLSGVVVLHSYNLIQSPVGVSFNLSATDAQPPIVNQSPDVGPLRFNGGLTQTRALLPGSPAIDRVPCLLSYSVSNLDQRGVSRPDGQQERLCDIGAYEFVDPREVPHV